MAVDYNVEIKGLKPLTNLFQVLVRDLSTKRVMSRIGNYVMTTIKQRTAEGVDVNYNPFKPYSDAHQKARAAKGLPTNVVDLFFHGTMMNAMTFDADDDRVRVYFMPTVGKDAKGKPSKAKSSEKAYYLNEQREFFALDAADLEAARQIAFDELDRIMKEK